MSVLYNLHFRGRDKEWCCLFRTYGMSKLNVEHTFIRCLLGGGECLKSFSRRVLLLLQPLSNLLLDHLKLSVRPCFLLG